MCRLIKTAAFEKTVGHWNRQTARARASQPEDEKAMAAMVGQVGTNPANIEGLVRSHQPELRNFAYRCVGSWADADDIVQQTYLRFMGTPKVAEVGNVRAYLFKMVRNLARDWIRSRRVRDSFTQDAVLRALDASHSAEHICASQDELTQVCARIANLPPQCRAALLLYRHEGLCLEEVGQRLGIQPRSVHKLIARAITYLLEAVPTKEKTPSGGGQ